MLQRRLSQVRLVFSISLTISQLDVHKTWRHYTLFQPKPYLTQIAGFAEGAKSIETRSTLIVDVDPGSRRFGISAAGRQRRRRSEHRRRIVVFVEHIQMVAVELLAARLVGFDAGQVKHGIW